MTTLHKDAAAAAAFTYYLMTIIFFVSVYNDAWIRRKVSAYPSVVDDIEAVAFGGRIHPESCVIRPGSLPES